MGKYASAVVKQAQAWLGIKESNGGHKEIVDTYNSHKPLARGYKMTLSDPWCATFVSAVAIKLGYTDIIPTECSCTKMIELLKKLGSWVENENRTPNPGDIIFYDWNDNGSGDNKGTPEHVGIVEKVENGKITVIEGNHDGDDADKIDGVEKRVIAVNGRYIRGYGVPKYDAETIKVETAAPAVDIDAIAKKVINGDFGNGATRKQNLIAKYGAEVTAKVQNRVNEMLTGKSTTTSTVDINAIAKKVINGEFGNGEARKKNLTAKYGAEVAKKIQDRVNEMLKGG